MLAFLYIVMVEIWELLVCVLTILAAFDIDCRLDSFKYTTGLQPHKRTTNRTLELNENT